MYAVFSEGSLSFLGDSQTEALQVFNDNPGSSLHTVNTVEEVKDLLDSQRTSEVATFAKQVKEDASDAMRQLMEKLREVGVNEELATKIKTGGEKLFGEARSLGVRGLKAVGDGFVNLGELLRKASENDEPPEAPERCGCEECQ